MGWDEDYAKLAKEANMNHWGYVYGALGVPNLVIQTEAMQREGVNKSDGFSGYLDEGEEYRNKFSEELERYGVSYITQWLLGIVADTILSNADGVEDVIIDLKEWMISNAKTIKTRAMTKGAWTPGATMGNKATLYVEKNDWLGEDIETGKSAYDWTMTCLKDKHLDSSYDFSGLMECKGDVKILNYFIGTGVVENYNFIAISGESSGNIIANNASFDDFSATASVKFTGWYSPDWTNISQSTTVYFRYRKGSIDSINRDGLGDSLTFTDNAEMWYYDINDMSYSRYLPYIYLQRYKYSTDCDGTNTLYLGSQSQACPVDGEPAAYTGTVEFIFGADPLKVRGVGTKFITEVKVGDILWNKTNDTIVDAQAVASIDDNLNITLAANYTATGGAGKALGGKHSGWHDLQITKYLSQFVEDKLKLGFKLTGNTAGTFYVDDQIHREKVFYPELARFALLVAGQTDLVRGDVITLSDSIAADSVVQRFFAMNITSTDIPLSLPHDPAPTNADPTKTTGTVEFIFGADPLKVRGVGTKFTEEHQKDDWIFNDTNDDVTDAQKILTVDDDLNITLAANYVATGGAAKVMGVHRY